MDQDRQQWLTHLRGLTGSARAAHVRNQVVNLLPAAAPNYQESLAAGKFYVVIEKHNQPFDFASPDPESFLWLCAKSTLSVRKVFAHYKDRCPEGDDSYVVAVAGDDPTEVKADSEVKFKDLPAPQEGVLLLTATRKAASLTDMRPSSAAETLPSGQKAPVAVENCPQSTGSYPQGPGARMPLQEISNLMASSPSRRPQTDTAMKNEAHSDPFRHHEPNGQAPQSNKAIQPYDSAPAYEKSPRKARDTMPEESQYQPRVQENPFVKDEPESELPARGGPLAQLTNEETPERLEAAVQVGLKVLASLESPLKDMPANEDTKAWLDQIAKVKEAATKTRTVVGVVGNTGAGKSSVINAMLDEERLVPTNCMRACTAVVTELSYNYSDNPTAKYRAQIEFISPEEWRRELKLIFQEVLDEHGEVSRDISSADSEAGIAYAKVRAVYNRLTKEGLTRTNVDRLMDDKKVRSLLGSTKSFSTSDPRAFYNKLQLYVDSKEKGTEKLDKNGNVAANQKRYFESWPLIKVVKIYTKSPALSTGAVIVDLPGVHDSNAARAAVAQGYMKQCTGLWIVAPINRAVDDKAAKNLLGDTFKRQLKFDGTYSAVSFICSKTDDISLTEATDSLKLGDRMADLDDKGADIAIRRRELTAELKDIKSSIKDFETSMEEIEADEEKWEELEKKHSQGRTVYAPSKTETTTLGRKRKSSGSDASSPARKRNRRTIESDDESHHSDRDRVESEALPLDDTANSAKQPLTENDIETKQDELKAMYKDARREKKALEARLRELRESLSTLDEEEEDLATQKTAIAIDARNTYSRTAIGQDFAAGIRELDQEAAEDEDADAFDPSESLRDYEEVARSLPVFCVSSRAYQKLSGRMKKDSSIPGYSMLAETEIPQLQAHCKKLTEKGRQASCRRFLNSIKQLLGSLGLWASDDGTGIKLTASQKDLEKNFLSKKLKELEAALEKVVTTTMADAADTIDDQLFAKFAPAVLAAAQEALPRAQKWGAHKSDGGLYWATYKATTRRSGVFAGASGARDFNADLSEPLYATLGGVWEKAFQRRLPNILQSLKKSASNVLKQFHVVVEDRSRKSGHGLARIGMIGANLTTYSAAIGDTCQEAVTKLNEGQRELSRQFTPVIAAAMEPVYEQCSQESGKGSFARMKAAMASHVGGKSHDMFKEASDQVQTSLKALCKSITKFYLERMDDIFIAMKRDYLSIVGGVVGQITMPKEERMVRRAVDEAIGAADELFHEVMDGDLEDLKADFAISHDETTGHETEDDLMATDNDDETDDDDDENDAEEGEKAVTDGANDTELPEDTAMGESAGFTTRSSSEE